MELLLQYFAMRAHEGLTHSEVSVSQSGVTPGQPPQRAETTESPSLGRSSRESFGLTAIRVVAPASRVVAGRTRLISRL